MVRLSGRFSKTKTGLSIKPKMVHRGNITPHLGHVSVHWRHKGEIKMSLTTPPSLTSPPSLSVAQPKTPTILLKKNSRFKGDTMKDTKSILWDYVVSKRVAVVKASKEVDEAMSFAYDSFDEKYTAWEESKVRLAEAELSWKEYNAITLVGGI